MTLYQYLLMALTISALFVQFAIIAEIGGLIARHGSVRFGARVGIQLAIAAAIETMFVYSLVGSA